MFEGDDVDAAIEVVFADIAGTSRRCNRNSPGRHILVALCARVAACPMTDSLSAEGWCSLGSARGVSRDFNVKSDDKEGLS